MQRALILVALLLVSGSVAQSTIDNPDASTPTTLYFHLDAHQDFPINTQLPDDRYAKGSSRGVLASTTTCSPDGAPGQVDQSHHTVYGFSTPGYVEYDFEEQGGPRIHPERGLAYDVELDTSGMTGYWYLKTNVDAEQSGGLNDVPVLVPKVVVEFTMRTGDAVSFGAEAYNAGQLIASGTSEPVDLYPDESNPAYRPQPDGSHVYEIPVPMGFEKDTLKADGEDGGYNLRVDVYTEIPGCDQDNSFMPGSVEIFTAPDYRPRLELAIFNPIQIEFIHPQFIGADLLIHTALNSPWGNYDVDESEGGISMVVTGPTPANSVQPVAFEQRHHEHGFHFEPVDVTYQWDYAADDAEAADYQLLVTVWNDQRTAFATGSATIDIASMTATDDEGNMVHQQELDEQETPMPLGLAVLALALFLARR